MKSEGYLLEEISDNLDRVFALMAIHGLEDDAERLERILITY